MSEFQNLSNEIAVLANSMFNGRPYRGVHYSNLQMYSPTISEDVDRECTVKPYAMSTLWPGGLPNHDSGLFGTFYFGANSQSEAYSQVSDIRTTLLSLQLSKRAIRRWDDSTLIKRQSNESNDTYVPVVCGMSNVPYASAVFSEVITHRRIKAGQTIAHLYFPSMLHDPRHALRELQSAQQAVIEDERI